MKKNNSEKGLQKTDQENAQKFNSHVQGQEIDFEKRKAEKIEEGRWYIIKGVYLEIQ